VLPIKGLVTSPASRPVQDLMEDTEIRVTPETDQEEVARLMGPPTTSPRFPWWMGRESCSGR